MTNEEKFLEEARKLDLHKFEDPKDLPIVLFDVYLKVFNIEKISWVETFISMQQASLFWRQQHGFIDFFNECMEMEEQGKLFNLLERNFYIYCVNSEICDLRMEVKETNMSYEDFKKKVEMSIWCSVIGHYVFLSEESLKAFTEDR